MTPNAVKKATALLAASLAFATPALAGDRAEFDPIGFSEDGRYFAFEEFGVQDGSGFPYSNIYVIDLNTDSWVKGTPVRVRLDAEHATIGEAREEAAEKAAPQLDSLDVDAPATILALNGDGEVGAPPDHLDFGPPGYGLSEVQAERQLALEVFDLPSAGDCAVIDDATKGFALTLDGKEIVRDTGTVPKSRGCPMDYRLYAVVAPADWSMILTGYVAIVSNYPFGYEGPDRRFIAIPLGN
jgi:predicted secreted protein